MAKPNLRDAAPIKTQPLRPAKPTKKGGKKIRKIRKIKPLGGHPKVSY